MINQRESSKGQVSRQIRLVIASGLVIGLLVVFLIWRAKREDELVSRSPLMPAQATPVLAISSPLYPPSATPLSPAAPDLQPTSPLESDSPLPVPPTGTPPVNPATLEALWTTRPTATPLSPSSSHWPYISPDTWRRWALWIMTAAGVLAFIGLRLRRGQ